MRAPWNGPAQVLDGKATADAIKAELAERVAALRERSVVPGLGTTLMGRDPGSVTYVAGKHRDCAEVGIESTRVDLPASAAQEQIEAAVDRLNADPACMGYIVQLPLPKEIDQNAAFERIDPGKDADGLHPANLGRLVLRGSGPIDSPLPCTSRAVIKLITRHGIDLEGKRVCAVGRGVMVGRSIGPFLIHREVNATVTVCRMGAKDLAAQVRQADVVVAAAGSAGPIMKDMAKPGVVVLDVGVSRIIGENGKSRLVGDVADGVDESASWSSPNPGGVGPMTRTLFVTNIVGVVERGAKWRQREGADRSLPALRLEGKTVMQPQVISEVGPLRLVLVHRPGREVNRLTPSNMGELLFDDLIWLERAQAEYDAMTSLMRKRGTEVLYFTDLPTEAFGAENRHEEALELVFTERTVGPAAFDAFRGFAAALAPAELVGVLTEGLTKREPLERIAELCSAWVSGLGPDDFILAPLPNHLFTQDTSSWIAGGVAASSMRKSACRRETINQEIVHRPHPRFAGKDTPFQKHGTLDGSAMTEGGDIINADNGALTIGASERTTTQGIERLAQRLFSGGAAREAIVLQIAKKRAQMHLDATFIMLDERVLTAYVGLGRIHTQSIRLGARGGLDITVHEAEEMESVTASALGLDEIRTLTVPVDSLTAEREQQNDGSNLPALEPGVVTTYERNTASSDYFAFQGFEVLTIPSNELGRGRGGARCMTCLIIRDTISTP